MVLFLSDLHNVNQPKTIVMARYAQESLISFIYRGGSGIYYGSIPLFLFRNRFLTGWFLVEKFHGDKQDASTRERLIGLILVMLATQMFLYGIWVWMKG